MLILLAAALLGADTPRPAPLSSDGTAMVADPCPPASPPDPALMALVGRMLKPGAAFAPPPIPPRDQPLTGQAARDWPALCRYRADNAALSGTVRVVFMGDSISELWRAADPGLFTGGVVDRGISGQTSAQMLLRFQADVIALKPRAVHILAGSNDVAGNTGPTTEQAYKDNIVAMTTLARANGIRVILGAIPPAGAFWWAPAMKPGARIVALNRWLADYARSHGFAFVDYHRPLATPDGGFDPRFANDGVHPNSAGYAIMRARLNVALAPYLASPPKGVGR